MTRKYKSILSLKITLVSAMLAISLAGCDLDFQVPPNQRVHMSAYEDGKLIFEQELAYRNPYLDTVNAWLASHRKKWEIGFITRPRGIYLEGKGFYVNALKNETCVKYCRREHLCQLYVIKDNSLYGQLENINRRPGNSQLVD